MHLRFKLLYLLFLPFSLPIAAQDPFLPLNDTGSLKSKLETMAGTTSTITSDFIQEKSLAVLSEKIISRGHFCFKKPDNIRWEYTSPYRYLIIISNNQLYTDDEKNKSRYDLQSNAMLSQMNSFISGCIRGDILNNDKDYSTQYFENSRQYFVKLIPRADKMRQMLNEVQIWFDKSDMTVSGLKMVEAAEDYTKIEFINKKLNQEIPVEKFTFH